MAKMEPVGAQASAGFFAARFWTVRECVLSLARAQISAANTGAEHTMALSDTLTLPWEASHLNFSHYEVRIGFVVAIKKLT